jgi:hypothetical protein
MRRPVADKATLDALLAKAKVPRHGPAIAFERDFGGLSFPDYGSGRSWKKNNEPAWLIGAAECLAADIAFRSPGRKKLVPVLYTTNDNVVYLDADGVAWGEDTIGDTELRVVAPDARSMMARELLSDHVFFAPENKKVEAIGARGKEVAGVLRLKPIREASDPAERWWSDGTTFVVERTPKRGNPLTTIAYAPKAALSKLGLAVPKPAPQPKGPVTFNSVMNEYASVSIVVRMLRKYDAVCSALFDVIERRVGASVSLAGGAFVGTIAAIDTSEPSTVRVQLALTGDDYEKKKSRAELFLRDVTIATLLNVFQFGVKKHSVEEVEDRWRDKVIAPLEASLPK